MSSQPNWQAIDETLQLIHFRAEAIADTLDPGRSLTAKDELTRTVISACDQIVDQVSRARRMIEQVEG